MASSSGSSATTITDTAIHGLPRQTSRRTMISPSGQAILRVYEAPG